MKKNFFIILIFVIISFIIIQKVRAQETGVIVSPPTFSKNLQEGTSYNQLFNVTNQKTQDNEFFITTRDITVDDNGQFTSVENQDGNNESTFVKNGWLTITPSSFFLKRGESNQFSAHFDVPLNFPTHGYYFEIVVTTKKPQEQGGKVGLVTEVAIPLSVNYIGKEDEIRKFAIATFDSTSDAFTTTNFLYEYPPVEFKTVLQNIGNVNVVPTGEIFISRDNSFSNVIATIPFNPTGQTGFAGTFREFQNTWDGGFLTLDDNNRLQVNFNQLSDFRIGQYYAQLNVVWDGLQGKEFENRIITFWIIPWKLILLLVGIIIVIIFLLIRGRRIKRRKNKQQIFTNFNQ